MFRLHDRKVLFILTVVYAAQGLRMLGSSAVFFHFKDELHLQSEGEAQILIATTYLPWYIKPVYGLISDSLPICGSHRKAYLLLAALIGCLSYMSFLLPLDLAGTMVALICGQLSQVVADIVADALMVVESRNDKEYGSSFLQAFSWSVMSAVSLLGGVLGSYFSYIGVTPSLVITFLSLAPVLIFIAGLNYQEPEKETYPRFSETISALKTAVTENSTYKTLIFLFILAASTPGTSQVMRYFLSNQLHFTNHFLYLISGASGVCYLTAAGIFSHWLKHFTLRRVVSYGQVLLMLGCLLDLCLILELNHFLGISSELFYAGLAYTLCTISGAFILFPTLVLAAQLCPPDIEATMYAFVSSVINFGDYTSELFGSGVTKLIVPVPGNYEYFYLFPMVQMGCKVVPLTLLWLLPKGKTCSEEPKGD